MGFLETDKVQKIQEKYPDFFYSKLKSFGFNHNSNPDIKTFVNWRSIAHFKFAYEYQNCEQEVKEMLRRSNLCKGVFYLLVEQGNNMPMIKVENHYFVEYWYDFLAENGFMGTTVISEDGKFVLEFTDDTDYLLYSNFPIAMNLLS
jgi:hypothetical protein